MHSINSFKIYKEIKETFNSPLNLYLAELAKELNETESSSDIIKGVSGFYLSSLAMADFKKRFGSTFGEVWKNLKGAVVKNSGKAKGLILRNKKAAVLAAAGAIVVGIAAGVYRSKLKKRKALEAKLKEEEDEKVAARLKAKLAAMKEDEKKFKEETREKVKKAREQAKEKIEKDPEAALDILKKGEAAVKKMPSAE
jgi:hypothetical protein